LVEDNDYDLELTLRVLGENRMENNIHVARDGEEALSFLSAQQAATGHDGAMMPKLIVLDLKLPRIDGHDVLRRLKTNPATKAIPVVILTSSNEDSDVARAYQLGANSYLQKPLNFDQFRNMVQQVGIYWLKVNEPPSRLP
jgi:CheY-like chemotaxis protein